MPSPSPVACAVPDRWGRADKGAVLPAGAVRPADGWHLPCYWDSAPRSELQGGKHLKRVPMVLPRLTGLDMLEECSVASFRNNVTSLRPQGGVPENGGGVRNTHSSCRPHPHRRPRSEIKDAEQRLRFPPVPLPSGTGQALASLVSGEGVWERRGAWLGGRVVGFKPSHYLGQPVGGILPGSQESTTQRASQGDVGVGNQPVGMSATLSVRHGERQMVSHSPTPSDSRAYRWMVSQSVSRTRRWTDRAFIIIY